MQSLFDAFICRSPQAKPGNEGVFVWGSPTSSPNKNNHNSFVIVTKENTELTISATVGHVSTPVKAAASKTADAEDCISTPVKAPASKKKATASKKGDGEDWNSIYMDIPLAVARDMSAVDYVPKVVNSTRSAGRDDIACGGGCLLVDYSPKAVNSTLRTSSLSHYPSCPQQIDDDLSAGTTAHASAASSRAASCTPSRAPSPYMLPHHPSARSNTHSEGRTKINVACSISSLS